MTHQNVRFRPALAFALVAWLSLAALAAGTAAPPAAAGSAQLPQGLVDSINTTLGSAPVSAATVSRASATASATSLTTSGDVAELNASGADGLGYSVALSADGTTAIAAAPYNGSSAAHIFRASSNGVWSTTGNPVATLQGEGTHGAVAISADGTTVAIGTPRARVWKGNVNTSIGSVLVYHVSDPSDWSSNVAPSATLSNPNGSDGDRLGTSVALSADGSTVLAGAPTNEELDGWGGLAYVFRARSATAWTGGRGTVTRPTAMLQHPSRATGISFGRRVALSGSGKTALISSPDAAYVYSVSDENAWASTAVAKAKLTGTAAGSVASVALASGTGATALVTGGGAAYVYDVASESAWADSSAPSATLPVSGSSAALSPNGNAALVGAPEAGNYGRAYLSSRTDASGPWKFHKEFQIPSSTGGRVFDFGLAGALLTQGDTTLLLIGSSGGAFVYAVVGPAPRPRAKPSITAAVPSAPMRSSEAGSFNATLAGSENATGKIEFRVVPDGMADKCVNDFAYGDSSSAGTASVNGDGTYTADFTPGDAGKYTLYARYPGDDRNEPTCSAGVPFEVRRAKPTIQVSAPAVFAIGSKYPGSDFTATLSGGHQLSGALRFVIFDASSDETPACVNEDSGPLSQVGINGPGTVASSYAFDWDFRGNAAFIGTKYWFQAWYMGDRKNEPVCASTRITVGPNATPTPVRISAPARAGKTAGKAIPASAITGGLEDQYLAGSGDFTFKVFGPQNEPPTSCTSGGHDLGTLSFPTPRNYGLGGNPPNAFTPGSGGTYWWYVSWSGDPYHTGGNSGCGWSMVSTVVTAAPTVSAPDGPHRVILGNSVTSTAKVQGGLRPTGSVTFSLATVKQSSIYTETVPLVNGVATTKPFRPTTPGTYYWLRTYNGDADNASVFQRDDSATTVVAAGAPSVIVVAAPETGTAGTAFDPWQFTAIVDGGRSPSGPLTFRMFGPQSAPPTDCSAGGSAFGSRTITNAGIYYPSDGFTPYRAGTYWLYVHYEGDDENAEASSPCGANMPKAVVAPGPSGAGQALISEVRLSPSDESQYVQVYNRSLTDPLKVAGWSVVGADGKTSTFGAGAVIPPAGHLEAKPAGGQWFSAGRSGGVKLVDLRDETVDAVGFSPVGEPAPASGYVEGAPVAVPTAIGQLAIVRNYASGVPVDTDANAADFTALDTAADGGKNSVLGAPRPDDPSSPTSRNDFLQSSLPAAGSASASPNRVITPGLLVVNRRITNCSGSVGGTGVCGNSAKISGVTVTKLRFRITDLTTVGSPGSGAVLKAVPSSDATYADGALFVRGLPLDAPSDPAGGGLNSTLTATALLPAGGLAPGASINVAFAFQIVKSGTFRFAFNTEDDLIAAPSTAPTPSTQPVPPASSEAPDTATGSLPAAAVASGSPGLADRPQPADGARVVAPATTAFRPILTALPSKVATSKGGTAAVKISCVAVDAGRVKPAECQGTLVVTARIGKRKRTIAKQAFSLNAGKQGVVSLKLSTAARAELRRRSLQTTFAATVAGQTSTGAVTLRKSST